MATVTLNVSLMSIKSRPESRPEIMDEKPDKKSVSNIDLFELFWILFRQRDTICTHNL